MAVDDNKSGESMPLKERARAYVDDGFEGTPDQFIAEAKAIIRALLRRHPPTTPRRLK